MGVVNERWYLHNINAPKLERYPLERKGKQSITFQCFFNAKSID